MKETENREYFRVDVRVPIEFRTISYDEFLDLENTIRHGSAQTVDRINEIHFLKEQLTSNDKEQNQIYAYVKMIDKKLDIILDLLSKPKEAGLYINKYININISGSGVRFVSDINLRKGEYTEMKVILPVPPYPKITSLCQVVRSKAITIKGAANWEVALNFLAISENDRDLLINYIFSKERVLLRMRKEHMG